MKFQLKPTNKSIQHSAKGTQWENHKYIKVEDGKYYYPDSYAGGRHLGNNDQQQQETVESKEPAGWENKLYSDFESGLRGANGKLDPKAVQQMLLFGKDDNGKGYDNFAIALSKAGIDASKIDPKSLNLMRYKVVEHYKQEFEKEKDNFDKEGNRTKDRTKEQEEKIHGKAKSSSSKKKSSSKTTHQEPEPEPEPVSTPTPTTSSQRKKKKNKAVTNRSGKSYIPGEVRHSIFSTMPYVVAKTTRNFY